MRIMSSCRTWAIYSACLAYVVSERASRQFMPRNEWNGLTLLPSTMTNESTTGSSTNLIGSELDVPADGYKVSHYNQHPSGVECIEVVEQLSFCLGTAVKHVWRLGLKEVDG